MNFARHPIWLAGFRPFFALACLAGMLLPALWTAIFLGALPAPAAAFSAFQWHAHEMFYGFGWAALGGFLLTSTKNWVRIRGYHGGALVFLAAAWLFERVGMWCADAWPAWLFLLSSNLFLAAIVAMLLWSLLRHRANDAYRGDNLFFVALLPLFLVAKHLLLSPENFQTGWTMSLALFRLCFLIMLERTLSQFMKAVFQADILRNARLDVAIKLLALTMVGADLLPVPLAAGGALTLALLLGVRFAFWQPQLGLSRIDIGVMYGGYLAIVAQLLVEFAEPLLHPAWVGKFSAHLFTFGTMGLIFPAMVMRISKGHTGRKVSFDGVDRGVMRLMLLALVLRIVAPQIVPGAYPLWIALAAACWTVGFGAVAWRYLPILTQPRVDGKEH